MNEPKKRSTAVIAERPRGLVCCFCGEAWGYEGEQPTEALLREAMDHEAKCPKNPYVAEIKRLKERLIQETADEGMCIDESWRVEWRRIPVTDTTRAIGGREAMKKNDLRTKVGRLRLKTWKPAMFNGCPKWQRSVKRVRILGDGSKLTVREMDYLFAIMASNGHVKFDLTIQPAVYERWMLAVDRRSQGAAERYERRMRAHFKRYKMEFLEGYSMPAPPTPELRAIYDSAARSESRPTRPCGTTLYSGFSGHEYHWRPWPLNNVVVHLSPKETA